MWLSSSVGSGTRRNTAGTGEEGVRFGSTIIQPPPHRIIRKPPGAVIALLLLIRYSIDEQVEEGA